MLEVSAALSDLECVMDGKGLCTVLVRDEIKKVSHTRALNVKGQIALKWNMLTANISVAHAFPAGKALWSWINKQCSRGAC